MSDQHAKNRRAADPRAADRPVPPPARRGRRPGRRVRAATAALLTLAAALAALLLGASPAAAHASLIDQDPAADEVLAEAPAEVVLTFSEEVATSADSIRVLDPDGTRVDTAEIARQPAAERGSAFGVPLEAELADGTYTVAWQVTSADSHPVAGAFTFSIGAPSQSTVDVDEIASDGADGAVDLLYDTGRFAAYTGYLLLAGSVVFVLCCWPAAAGLRTVQRVAVVGWSLLTGATMALLLLRQPFTTGGGIGDTFGVSALGEVLDTRIGTALAARLLLLAAVSLFLAALFGPYARAQAERQAEGGEGLAADGRGLRDLTAGLGVAGALLGLGLAATWAMAEHASTGPQTAVAIPADMVHLAAAAAWLGGLATLLPVLFRETAVVPRRAVLRFSALALGSVGVLAATGLYQSWRQVQSWEALFTTPYGRLLLVKSALVALLIAGGWFSRRWTARIGDPAAPGPEGDPASVDGRGGGTSPGGHADADVPATVPATSSAIPPHATAPHATVASGGGPEGAGGGAPGSPGRDSPDAGGAPRPRAAAGQVPERGADASDTPGGADAPADRSTTGSGGTATNGAPRAPVTGTETATDARTATGTETGTGTGTGTGTETGTGTGTGTETGAAPAAAVPEGPPPGTAHPDPARAAQLARQQAAVRRTRQQRTRDADGARTGLRRSVLIETGIAVLLIAVTTGLTGSVPARVDAESEGADGAAGQPTTEGGPISLTLPFDTGGEGGQGTAHVDIDPGSLGDNTLHIRTTGGPDDAPLPAEEIRVAVTLPAEDLGPLRFDDPPLVDTGHWTQPDFQLPRPGDWEFSLTIRTSDIDQVTETETISIG